MTFRQFLTKRAGTFLILAPIIVVAVFVLPTIGQRPPDPEGAPTILPVATVTVRFVDSYESSQTYTGEVHARRTTRLSFERPGRVIELKADEGQSVPEGRIIGRLDARQLDAELARVTAARDEAQAVLDELRAGPRAETLASQKAAVEAIEADLAQARADEERAEPLHRNGTMSQEEWDAVRFRVRGLAARLETARQGLLELREGTRKERIRAQEARLRGLESQLLARTLDVDQAKLRAPFAGRISRRFLDEGSVVQAGTAVYELVETARLEARIGVPPAVAFGLEEGTKVKLEVRGRSLDATLRGLRPESSRSTRTRTVLLDFVPTPKPAPAPGELVRWRVERKLPEKGAWIPLTALRKSVRGLWSCYVLEKSDDASLARIGVRQVHLLHTEADRALVGGTLHEGDRIVATGIHRVVPGQLVRATESR